MNNRLNPAISKKKLSIQAIGEFLVACLKVGESNVIHTLRKIQTESNEELKKFIIYVTCQEFGVGAEILYREKKKKKTGNKRMAYGAIIFFTRKYIATSYNDVAKTLQLNYIKNTNQLSVYFTEICRLNGKDTAEKEYLIKVENIDKKIKEFIEQQTLNDYTNGTEKIATDN